METEAVPVGEDRGVTLATDEPIADSLPEAHGESEGSDPAASGDVPADDSGHAPGAMDGSTDSIDSSTVGESAPAEAEVPTSETPRSEESSLEEEEAEVRLEGLRLRQVIESILFAAGEPISSLRLRRLLPEAKPAAVREELLALQGDLASQARGFTLVEENGGYRLLTRMEFAPFVSRLRGNKRRIRLSKAAFETLAVIAYRQPVRRSDLDAIRGVQSSAIVKNLLEWNLVQVAGQDEGIGKALLFGTTAEFLDQFGLASLGDLPHPTEFAEFGSDAPSEVSVEVIAEDATDGVVAEAETVDAEMVEAEKVETEKVDGENSDDELEVPAEEQAEGVDSPSSSEEAPGNATVAEEDPREALRELVESEAADAVPDEEPAAAIAGGEGADDVDEHT